MANSKIETKAPEAPKAQEPQNDTPRRFVNVDTPIADMLVWDAAGDLLYFEPEKGRFKELTEDEVNALHHVNKVRYSAMREVNANHDPEGDEWKQRIRVTDQRDRRAEFESKIKSTAQSSRATKKLEAFVGNNYEPLWARPDKIEDRLAQGYEIVNADDKNVYAGVASVPDAKGGGKVGSHYEIRSKQGEPELVLMRVSKERKSEIMAAKNEAAQRLAKAGQEAGKSELRQLGASIVTGEQAGLAWQDR